MSTTVRTERVERDRCRMVSASDVLTPNGSTSIRAVWEPRRPYRYEIATRR